VLVAYTLEPSESEPGFLSRLTNPKAHTSLSHRLPYLIYFAWTKVSVDEFVTDDMHLPAASESELFPVVDAEDSGRTGLDGYHALRRTMRCLEHRWGRCMGEHLDRLREIKKKYDPEVLWDLQVFHM
jgi:hypothetical protein